MMRREPNDRLKEWLELVRRDLLSVQDQLFIRFSLSAFHREERSV